MNRAPLRAVGLAAVVVGLLVAVAIGALARTDTGTGPGADLGPQPSGRAAVVWAVGDGADGNARSRALAARIASGPLDRFLYLGDVYERGTYAEFLANYRTVYGRLAPKTSPTPGNHDWPNHLEGYDRYWGQVQRHRQPPYYSFSIAGWRVFSLNSEIPHGEGSAQLRWVTSRLGRGTCRIAYWHRPRFSAGTHGDQTDMDPVWRALRGRAALVLAGHDHDSQRLKPRDGIVELVAGAGGGSARLYPLKADRRLAFGNARDLAAVRVTLAPGRARFAFVRSDGRRLNAGEVPCRS